MIFKTALGSIKDRVIGSGKLYTAVGTLLGAAIAGAAKYYAATGDTSNWQGYAIAGGVAAAGAVLKGKEKPPSE